MKHPLINSQSLNDFKLDVTCDYLKTINTNS